MSLPNNITFVPGNFCKSSLETHVIDLNSHDLAHGSWLTHENRKALAHMLYMRLILKFYQKNLKAHGQHMRFN